MGGRLTRCPTPGTSACSHSGGCAAGAARQWWVHRSCAAVPLPAATALHPAVQLQSQRMRTVHCGSRTPCDTIGQIPPVSTCRKAEACLCTQSWRHCRVCALPAVTVRSTTTNRTTNDTCFCRGRSRDFRTSSSCTASGLPHCCCCRCRQRCSGCCLRLCRQLAGLSPRRLVAAPPAANAATAAAAGSPTPRHRTACWENATTLSLRCPLEIRT